MLIFNELELDYRRLSGEYLTSHLLADYIRCPETYRKIVAGETVLKRSRAYVVGSALHTFILEPHLFPMRYCLPISDTNGKTLSKRNKIAKDVANGRTILSPAETHAISGMSLSVMRTIGNRVDFAPEVVARGMIRGVHCQSRFDMLFDHGDHCEIWDIKTCRNFEDFETDIERWGYVLQCSFYRMMVGVLLARMCSLKLLAVEKQEPFRSAIFEIDNSRMDHCIETEIFPAIDRLKKQRVNDANC